MAKRPPLPEVHLPHARVAVVHTSWYGELMETLLARFSQTLREQVDELELATFRCAGSFELPQSCALVSEELEVDGIAALGIIVQGETSHHHYLAQAVIGELAALSTGLSVPLVMGVITAGDLEQARHRVDPQGLDRGREFALSLLTQMKLFRQLREAE